MSDSLWPHEQQYARPPCPSPTPGACSNLCLLSGWCHPTISSSAVPFSSHLQSFPASGSFQMSHLFASGGQSIGVSISASVLPMTIQDWFPLGLTGLILQSKGLSRVFSNSTVQRHQFFSTLLSLYNFTKVEKALSQERICLNFMVVCLGEKKVKSLSHVWLFVTLWTLACQAPPFMGISMQKICNELPFPSPGDLPDPEIKPRSSAL